ncbi:MAG: OmpA family protein [Acidobacteriaceae bacterium]|nr:OmpA family protein [Acidobacteriaceae bacterium]
MRRRKKQANGENHERWLVSYADFITLLFAFFVVMFASSQRDKAHAKAISDSIERALQNNSVPPKLLMMLGGNLDKTGRGIRETPPSDAVKPATQATADKQFDLAKALQILQSELASEIKKGTVHVSLESRGLVISLQAAAFFPSGDDSIDPAARGTIGKVASVLNHVPNPLRLEGNTDSVPISNGRFHNNWELSSARAIAMLRLLSEHFNVESRRMAVVGYADTSGVASNETEEGRGRNRRVDIVIVSDFGMRGEPHSASTIPSIVDDHNSSQHNP